MLNDEKEEFRREALSLESAHAHTREGMDGERKHCRSGCEGKVGFESTAQTPLSCWIIYTEMFRRVYHQFLP